MYIGCVSLALSLVSMHHTWQRYVVANYCGHYNDSSVAINCGFPNDPLVTTNATSTINVWNDDLRNLIESLHHVRYLMKKVNKEIYLQQDVLHNTSLNMNYKGFIFEDLVLTSKGSEAEHFEIVSKSKYVNILYTNTSMEYLQTHIVSRKYYKRVSNKCNINPGFSLRCQSDPDVSFIPVPLKIEEIQNGLPFMFPMNSSNVIVDYLYILRNGVAGRHGDLYSQDTIVQIERCYDDINNPDWLFTHGVNELPFYNEVFSITIIWGAGYYHIMIEQFPRLAPYIEFLITNPKIKIHVTSLKSLMVNMMVFLGISKDRLVSGPVRAKYLYAPAGVPCSQTALFNLQVLSLNLRYNLYMQQRKSPNNRSSIVLIKRSRKRNFFCHDKILKMLENIAPRYGLTVELYRDDPTPGFIETTNMFHRAVMIVGPHGAGLSNMIFSDPGTIIIEGWCFYNPCFADLAYRLGHRYYGLILNLDKTCHEFKVYHLEPIVRLYLHMLLKKNNL